MFAYFLQRMIALIFIVKGWELSTGHGWRWVLGMLLFIFGVFAFEAVIRNKQRRDLMPHRWKCPINGCPTEIESSHEAAFHAMRQEHNRTVHLWEY